MPAARALCLLALLVALAGGPAWATPMPSPSPRHDLSMGDWPPQRYALLSFALFGPIGLSVGYLPTGRLDRAILTPFGVWAVTLGSAYVGANIASLPYRFRDKDAFYWTPKEVEYQGMWIGGGIGLAASCGYVLMDQALPPPWAPWLTPALSLITVTCIYSALTSNQ